MEANNERINSLAINREAGMEKHEEDYSRLNAECQTLNRLWIENCEKKTENAEKSENLKNLEKTEKI